MPGVCFKRDAKIQARMWSAHLDTVLSRDLQLLRATETPLARLRDLYSELARRAGEPINQSALARQIRISSPTLKQLLIAFEGLFLIRPHGKAYFCEDHGLANFAAGGAQGVPAHSQLARFVFSELWAQINYLHKPGSVFTEYRTRGGAWVPFVAKIPNLGTIAITVDPSPQVSVKSLQSLTSFSKKHPGCKRVAIHQGQLGYLSSTGVACIPWTWIA
jgi:hypothetical protein